MIVTIYNNIRIKSSTIWSLRKYEIYKIYEKNFDIFRVMLATSYTIIGE